ncbi:tRNA 2-thiouridine(34) synthase MnmA [soil metagenome]
MQGHSMNTKRTKPSIFRTKVFVGLSGGVDSAVSAALLLKQGYDVTGVFIKVWSPDFLPCTWREERRDAMRVAAHLNIPFLFFDFEKEYKAGVADYMIDEYKVGRTPNPDVMCNKVVKFGAFWQKAKEMGADFIATGHYAQVQLQVESYQLLEGKDEAKDQSYFLWTLTNEDLSHTLFPVGGFEKTQVRELARHFNIPVAEKKDSQGICFIGEITLDEFLSEFIETKKGDVLDTKGNTIGTHKGAIFYTLGERHGFDVTKKKPTDGAFYVVSKDMMNNTITVSSDTIEIDSLSYKNFTLSNINLLGDYEDIESARIRYRGQKLPVVLTNVDGSYKAELKEPERGVSVGQSMVFYKGDKCLGGAVIEHLSPHTI